MSLETHPAKFPDHRGVTHGTRYRYQGKPYRDRP